VHWGREKERALEVDDCDGFAARRVDDGQTAPGSGEIGGSQHALVLFEDGNDVAVAPDVVAGCENVRAGGEELLRELRRQPQSVRDVFRVDDAEIDVELAAKVVEPRLDGAAARWPEDVAEKENAQSGRF
jgi:hypothetical protein